VDTTGVSEMSNPVRFGHEFAGRLANPRDALVFTRARKAAAGARSKAARGAAPDLSHLGLGPDADGDDGEGGSAAERLSRVRVETLVREYLAQAELQLLGEAGMGAAIAAFVEKDDPHAIAGHVGATIKRLVQGIAGQVGAGGDVGEDALDDAVRAHQADGGRG
jgi:double-strand break repair protein MRE11